jgi:hypothetical protein
MYLYEKHLYLNKNIDYLISNEIVEYDIQSAGFNLLKKYKLVDENKIKHLESLDKKTRQVQIGLYIKYDKELGKKLNIKFVEIRKWFFEQNNLQDDEVLSIKKDAIMTLRRCLNTELDNIKFVEKNIYTSYYHINNKEFYYNKDVVHVKGIDDELLKLHEEYMLDFLYNFFKMNEISKKKKVIELIKDFSYYYKAKKLEIGYYRELSNQSLFRLNDVYYNKNVMGVHDIGDVNKLDIGYNYFNYIVPLISILI